MSKNYTTIFIDAEGHELDTDKNGSAIVVCDRMHSKKNSFTSIKVYPPLTDTFTEAQAKATLAVIKRISAAQFYADENRGASAAEVVAVQEGQKDKTGKYIAVYVGDNCKLNRRGEVIDDKGYTGKKPDPSDTGKKPDPSDTGKKPDPSDTGKKPEAPKRFTSDDAIALIDAMWEE